MAYLYIMLFRIIFLANGNAVFILKALIICTIFVMRIGCGSENTRKVPKELFEQKDSLYSSCSDTVFSGMYVISKCEPPYIGTSGIDCKKLLGTKLVFDDTCLSIGAESFCNIRYNILEDTIWESQIRIIHELERLRVIKKLGWNKPFFEAGYSVGFVKPGSCEYDLEISNESNDPYQVFVREANFIHVIDEDSILYHTGFGVFLAVSDNM